MGRLSVAPATLAPRRGGGVDGAFIAYSRRDREFVRRLDAALVGRGKETWVDWESIPPTAEWLAEVYAGGARADALVFVLSPASARSKVCGLELARAIEGRKRLIPLVCR